MIGVVARGYFYKNGLKQKEHATIGRCNHTDTCFEALIWWFTDIKMQGSTLYQLSRAARWIFLPKLVQLWGCSSSRFLYGWLWPIVILWLRFIHVAVWHRTCSLGLVHLPRVWIVKTQNPRAAHAMGDPAVVTSSDLCGRQWLRADLPRVELKITLDLAGKSAIPMMDFSLLC